MMEEEIYDFIVIGSGMGGLVSSAILAKHGYSVLVLEKNQQIGGSLQVFSRDKRIFDTGVHYIGSLDKGETLYQIFNYLGILDSLKLHRLDNDRYELIRLKNGKSFPLGQGFENFSKQLKTYFSEEHKAIDQFLNKIKETCNYFPIFNLKEDNEDSYLINDEILELDAWEYVCSITENEELRSVLLGNGPLYAAEKGITPFYVVALITYSYLSGSYRLKDGGSQIAKALLKVIRANGGEVLKRKEVVQANFDNKTIGSVTTKDGSTYRAKNYISNTTPVQTVKTFGLEKFRPAYRKRLSKLVNTISSFTVHIALKKESFPYMNYNIYDYSVNNKDIWSVTDYNKQSWPQVYFLCTPTATNQGKYADSLSVMAYMDFKEVEQWKDTFNAVVDKNNRGKSYDEFKKNKEEQLIDKLEENFPEIRNCIENVYSSSPLTYKDYIGNEDGSLYGIRKDVNKTMATIINPKTSIPNLFLTGQNIVFHGILGTTIGALVSCLPFVDKKKLLEEIREK